MARRAELFVRELSDGEAAHLLQLSKRGSNAGARPRGGPSRGCRLPRASTGTA